MTLRKQSSYSHTRCAAMVIALAILIVMSGTNALASGPLEKVIYNFQFNNGIKLDGTQPLNGLIADAAGNLYGTTSGGGISTTCPCGTVFEVSPPASPGGAWTETLLHSFSGGATEGANPFGALTFDSAGNLYGTTIAGGPNNFGTVFELSPPATAGGDWTETVLYFFPKNGHQGIGPGARVAFDRAGNLFGTAGLGGSGSNCRSGGDQNCGVVFELTPPTTSGGAWTQKVVYTFGIVDDDEFSPDNLVFDHAGALYGTSYTSEGGAVFQLVRDHGIWSKNILYSFGPGSDVGGPDALTFDSSGNLFAVAGYGGDTVDCPSGCGGVFELSPPAVAGDPWVETTLYTFTGGKDGANPLGKLAADKAGNLYGTTRVAGLKNKITHDNGTVFELSPPAVPGGAWTETTLHQFGGTQYNDGSEPFSGLTLVKGKFYGTTNAGGTLSFGTVFSLVIVP